MTITEFFATSQTERLPDSETGTRAKVTPESASVLYHSVFIEA
jgi:hypothetical protein